MRPENRADEGECYQVNHGIRAVYNESSRILESLEVGGQPVVDSKTYKICMQGFHVRNSASFLNITYEELAAIAEPKVVSTSIRDVLGEYLRNNQNVSRTIEGRLVYQK